MVGYTLTGVFRLVQELYSGLPELYAVHMHLCALHAQSILISHKLKKSASAEYFLKLLTKLLQSFWFGNLVYSVEFQLLRDN